MERLWELHVARGGEDLTHSIPVDRVGRHHAFRLHHAGWIVLLQTLGAGIFLFSEDRDDAMTLRSGDITAFHSASSELAEALVADYEAATSSDGDPPTPKFDGVALTLLGNV
jgi:hypothetical protein